MSLLGEIILSFMTLALFAVCLAIVLRHTMELPEPEENCSQAGNSIGKTEGIGYGRKEKRI